MTKSGRRNSLFFGSHKGAQRAAMFYSLACSCRLNNVNFFEYADHPINIYHPEGEYLKGLVLYVE